MTTNDVVIIGAGPSGCSPPRSCLYGPDMSELRAMSFDGADCRCEFQCTWPRI
jgi:hypothetical protein